MLVLVVVLVVVAGGLVAAEKWPGALVVGASRRSASLAAVVAGACPLWAAPGGSIRRLQPRKCGAACAAPEDGR